TNPRQADSPRVPVSMSLGDKQGQEPDLPRLRGGLKHPRWSAGGWCRIMCPGLRLRLDWRALFTKPKALPVRYRSILLLFRVLKSSRDGTLNASLPMPQGRLTFHRQNHEKILNQRHHPPRYLHTACSAKSNFV